MATEREHLEGLRSEDEREFYERTGCTCLPCTTPGRGAPGIEHCAACCYGTLITEYDHGCPVAEHQEMAIAQWGAIGP